MKDNKYVTKGTFPLGNQISLSNVNSNIDKDYGPYDSTEYTKEEIIELLKTTIQIGKTIGVVENGKVVEYWAQPKKEVTEVKTYADLEFVNKSPDITISDSSGCFKVNDNDVSIFGLENTAFINSSYFATSAQGSLADTALQQKDFDELQNQIDNLLPIIYAGL